MAITANSGGVANSNNASVASLAAASFTATASALTRVIVVLLDNTQSVSSVSTNGTGTYSFVAALDVSSTLRIELWESTNESSGAGRIVTANFSASVVSAIAVQQWSGEVAVLSGNPTESNTNYYPQGRFTTQFSTDFAVSYLGFNGGAGDTITAEVGSLRRSSIGAAGGAGVAIVDSNGGNMPRQPLQQVKLNASREWGSIGQGLKATTTVKTFEQYEGYLPLITGFKLVIDFPQGGGGGILPPSGAHGQLFPPAIL